MGATDPISSLQVSSRGKTGSKAVFGYGGGGGEGRFTFVIPDRGVASKAPGE